MDLRKVSKLMALAGDEPKTPEQVSAYKMAKKYMERMAVKDVATAVSGGPRLLNGPVKVGSFWDKFKKIKTVRTLDWFDYVDPSYVCLQITPDSSARNYRAEDLVGTIADQFRLPIDRVMWEGLKIKGYRVQERTSFEIDFKDGKSVTFKVYTPSTMSPLIQRRIQSIWDKATVEVISDRPEPFNPDQTAIYELIYRRHDIFSLHTDKSDNTPLGSILEAGRLVGDGERAKVFTYFDPIHQPTYQNEMRASWDKFKKGVTPRKWSGSGREIAMGVSVGVAKILAEILGAVSELISDGKENNKYTKTKEVDPEASKYAMDNLSASTKRKAHQTGVNTLIWAIAESHDPTRADMIARSLGQAYGDLTLDNELEARPVSKRKKQEYLKTVETHKPPKIKVTFNKMSTAEAGKLTQITGRELLEAYPEVDKKDHNETKVSDKLMSDKGMYLGEATFKGETKAVYKPVDNHDELCLPTVVIGGMGQGKSGGYGANTVYEAVKKGFGAMFIDPAKGEVGDQLEKVLKPEEILRINLGKEVYSLGWSESLYDQRSKSRLAGTIMAFFNTAGDDTGGQTERFLRAGVMAMRTGKMSELIKIFNDMAYLEEVAKDLPEGLNKTTLDQFRAESEARRRQILSPIYNRLNYIMSDPHLAECIESDNELDMVKLMSQKKAIIIDVPDDSLDSEAKDIFINLICSKVDLAMRLRENHLGKGNLFPYFLVLDEPHQYLRSAELWKSATVEARKYRLSYVWLFHYWEQLPLHLQKAIKGALPHYHLYPSSKETFKSLSDEIYPFTQEDAKNLKRFNAINIIRSGGENVTPFICHMAPPPVDRLKKK